MYDTFPLTRRIRNSNYNWDWANDRSYVYNSRFDDVKNLRPYGREKAGGRKAFWNVRGDEISIQHSIQNSIGDHCGS